jgi:transcriptional activator Myb
MRLMSVVKKFGATKWSHIAKHIPFRTGKQCRERWFNHLSPSIKKEEWSTE